MLTSTGTLTPLSTSPDRDYRPQPDPTWPTPRSLAQIKRSASEELLPTSTQQGKSYFPDNSPVPLFDGFSTPMALPEAAALTPSERSASPPSLSTDEAVSRAKALSEKLSGSNIPSRITESGDLMLYMGGYKSSEEDVLRAEVIARKILAEELEGNYDIGALIGVDGNGNLWIYSSEEAKEAATREINFRDLGVTPRAKGAVSDLRCQSEDEALPAQAPLEAISESSSADAVPVNLDTPPVTPQAEATSSGDPNLNYAKTLRLTSNQLKDLHLTPGANLMSFSVNKATCQAYMYYWTYDVPIVISDIDGTITKYI